MEILGRAKAVISKFKKAIELLRLKFAKKHVAVFFAVLIFVVVGIMFPHGRALAWGPTDWLGTKILEGLVFPVIYVIFWLLFFIAYAVAYLGAYILDLNLNPLIIGTVLNSPMVTQSWAIFRDIANLFFILILLFIAIGTIVRSQSYNLKNLLPKLIIAVFLINFSAVIAKVIIDFGNIFMYGVLKWMNCPGKEECFRDFFPNLMGAVDGFWGKYQMDWRVFSPSIQNVVGLVIATLYTFIYGLILIALGTFLMIRIAAFAILIILSPLAFVGEVFPRMQELSTKWWKNLVNYTLFGPIFALLLYVSGLMAQIQITVPTIGNINVEAIGTFGNIYATVIQYAIPLIFLLAIIPITQELGIAGANAVLGSTVLAGGAFLAGATKFAGGAIDRYLARGAQKGHGTVRKALSYASPGAWKRALKAHSAEAEHDYGEAAGQFREDVVERVTDWPDWKKRRLKKSAVKHKDDEHQRGVKRWQEEVKGRDKNELVYLMQEALDEGMIARAEGVARELAVNSDMNEVYTKMKDKEGNFYLNTAAGFEKFMEEIFEPVLGENETGKLMAVLTNLEKKDGNQSFKGTSYFDDKTGEYKMRRLNSDTEMARKEAERLNTTPEAIRKQAERNAAEERARELGSGESQNGVRNLDSRSLVAPKYERKEGKIVYENGQAKVVKKDGVEQWEYDYGGIAGLRKMTEKQIFTMEKAKPKHQARYFTASTMDKNEKDRIGAVIRDQMTAEGITDNVKIDLEIDSVIAKVGRVRVKLNEAIYGETIAGKGKKPTKQKKKEKEEEEEEEGQV